MFKLDTEQALLESFRPKDRKVVDLGTAVKVPVFVRDYLAWTHPSGGRVFLVFQTAGGVPTGIVFDSNGGSGTSVPNMCDWCHHAGMGTQVGMLTATVNAKKKAGVNVCVDLSCGKKIEDECARQGISERPALDRLVSRMGRFAEEVLAIDLSGAGR